MFLSSRSSVYPPCRRVVVVVVPSRCRCAPPPVFTVTRKLLLLSWYKTSAPPALLIRLAEMKPTVSVGYREGNGNDPGAGMLDNEEFLFEGHPRELTQNPLQKIWMPHKNGHIAHRRGKTPNAPKGWRRGASPPGPPFVWVNQRGSSAASRKCCIIFNLFTVTTPERVDIWRGDAWRETAQLPGSICSALRVFCLLTDTFKWAESCRCAH